MTSKSFNFKLINITNLSTAFSLYMTACISIPAHFYWIEAGNEK